MCVCGYVCVYMMCVCGLHPQEDECSQEDEEWVLHQVGVGPHQPGQVGVPRLQLQHPALPTLEHGGQAPERTATLRRTDTGEGVEVCVSG